MAFSFTTYSCVLLLSSMVTGVHLADVKEENDVLVLDRANFNDVVKESETLLVEFYAPWCGHCKSLEPQYAAAAKQLKAKNVALAKVDATVESGLASDYGVEGYPTLKIFKKAYPGDSFDYEGPRDTAGIVQFMEKVASSDWKPTIQLSGLLRLTNDNLTEAMQQQEAWLVGCLATDADSARGLLSEVADRLKRGRQRRAVGFVLADSDDGRALAERLCGRGVQLPAFAVASSGSGRPALFGHSLSADNLEKFYRAHSSEKAPPAPTYEKLSQLDEINDGVEPLVLGHFDDGSDGAALLKNFLLESGFLFDRRLEGGLVSPALAKQLGIEKDSVVVRLPTKLLAPGEQQNLRYGGRMDSAAGLKAFFDQASLPLVGYYTWNTKEVYRRSRQPVCLFLLTVAFKGEMQSSTRLWHSRFADIAKAYRGSVLFAMADDEQEEEEVKRFRLEDSSSDVNVGCYDAEKRRFALPEIDSFDADEIRSFIDRLLAGSLQPVLRSVTAKSGSAAGLVQQLTGDTFERLVLKDSGRSHLVMACDINQQPCKHSLAEFAAAAASEEARAMNVQFATLDTALNDAPGEYYYRVSVDDVEMTQPQLLLGIAKDKAKPRRYTRDAVAKDYVLQFLKDNLPAAKQEL